MKKSFFLAAFAAALALVGCQKQSELDFDDIKTKATVQGYVYIDLGYIQEVRVLPNSTNPLRA